jgi:hypothetical protein
MKQQPGLVSLLAALLADFPDVPLQQACAALAHPLQHSLQFDWSHLPRIYRDSEFPGARVTLVLGSEHPFKDCLGMLLEQANCQARLEGGKIVVEPGVGNPLALNP